ncbi:MAG: tyrosine--tRNA ligase [Candidatus Komeilibacteria bacterium CG11_big_fil_rev_8_21_14_0_20_36_20]|uniref:Tyrosine--tRNA ligase n=1 Tax=Candidatus Komeilibacteria bacterium CG11_big_fil_rev_8_21_14_0_20_36_20 TaxID=1974477 RepID=A0A2H0ND27_9BACT|nr:MAG: tyrosine--tRNA ligase [Candidatus Komeilibacteria bacterium CG11_big_fil_rev_8_21_14_0_20_36_20]PIR81790.1 MAG: tyrosine--tRNA ligase [Candidatus Komeilibacteria bacterium CG10_big_fil_rev_8_21_14_0_10_36_65]PJC55280.1 MAG: tyrosine--tRNA ligase [Candidatus Komeilibacteria bacterium CG_4_9_14_0_2_um_filter_36_13]
MNQISTNSEKIQVLITRGVKNIYPSGEYLKKLLKSGQQLTLYLGIDPTGPSLHLGHAIILDKLRQFQELGHRVILLIGNFTATIGDPTDKTALRQPLDRGQILENAKDYKKQAKRFISFNGRNKAQLKYNGKWFDQMNFDEVLKLSSHFTIQQLLERDMFEKRIQQGKPISLHELMYPVMQAYDSVALNTDGEVGGNDQTFNMLAGRTLMKSLLNKEKFVLTLKLLADVKGIKMGKTEGNMVNLNDSPTDMFGKIMSWTDKMIVNGFELCTRVPMTEIDKIEQSMQVGANPRDYKFQLAKEIVSFYYSEKEAEKTGQEFIKIFAKKEQPNNIQPYKIPPGKINPINLLIELKFVPSRNEAKRLIEGGGFKINNQKITSWQNDIQIKSQDVIQAGKRKFGQIT